MKAVLVFELLAVLVFTVHGGPASGPTKEAPDCEQGINCIEPACRCASTTIPLSMAPADTPQIVMLTFDDNINTLNIIYYRQLFSKYSPGNGCPVGVTHFASHEYNDYSLLHEVYANGHDISIHSISHKSDTSYWANADYCVWEDELVGMRYMASKYGAVPIEDINGYRNTFLVSGDDNQFSVLYNNNFLWDSSLPTQIINPPLWPFTLDYKSTQDCKIVGSYPGFWEMPMVDYIGGNNASCSMVDQCQPAPTSAQDAFDMFKRNFDRHYTTNRAPFGVYAHAAWFQVNETNNWQGYIQFLDYLATLPDVYIVTVTQAMRWMQNPMPIADLFNPESPFLCAQRTPPSCTPITCHYTADETPFHSERYMISCVTCPPYYPWLGNLDGLNPYTLKPNGVVRA